MTKKTLARTIIAVLMAAVLGGASLIIAKNGTEAGGETPSGFVH